MQYTLSTQSAQAKGITRNDTKQKQTFRGTVFGTGIEEDLGVYRLRQEIEEEEEKHTLKTVK